MTIIIVDIEPTTSIDNSPNRESTTNSESCNRESTANSESTNRESTADSESSHRESTSDSESSNGDLIRDSINPPSVEQPYVRRSSRIRRMPNRYGDFISH